MELKECTVTDGIDVEQPTERTQTKTFWSSRGKVVSTLALLLQLVLLGVFAVLFTTVGETQRQNMQERDSAVLTSQATNLGWGGQTHTIYIIRHAEKTPAGGELSEIGWQRARYIASLWSGSSRFMRPKSLFANGRRALNSRQTLEPLSKLIGVPYNDTYHRRDNPTAAAAILKSESPTLVAWEHKMIYNLTALLSNEEALSSLPPGPWAREEFDMIVIITLSSGAPSVTYDWERFTPTVDEEITV